MKSYIDYGALINGEYTPMTRKQWILSVQIIFQDTTREIKEYIKRARLKATKYTGYYPGNWNYQHDSNRVLAMYNIDYHQTYYRVKPYGPGKAMLIAAMKTIQEYFRYDPAEICPCISRQFAGWQSAIKVGHHYGLIERWEPHKYDIDKIIEDLSAIGMHREANELEILT